MSGWHDVHGEGPPVVLLHAGLTDNTALELALESPEQLSALVLVAPASRTTSGRRT